MSRAHDRESWMHPVDEAILRYLAVERAEYPALIANRVGSHTGHVERRCAVLERREYVEAVSGEVVYRITDRGRNWLD
jgi:DNA-binding PadR family transcriptional regulator